MSLERRARRLPLREASVRLRTSCGTTKPDAVIRQMIVDRVLEDAQRAWGRAEVLASLARALTQARIELLRAEQIRLSAGRRNRSANEAREQHSVARLRSRMVEIRAKPSWDGDAEFKQALLTRYLGGGIAGLCSGQDQTTVARHLAEIELIEAAFSKGFRLVPIDVDDGGESGYHGWCRGVVYSVDEWGTRFSAEPPRLEPWQWLAGVVAWTHDPKSGSAPFAQACGPGWYWLRFDDARTVAGISWRKVAPRTKTRAKRTVRSARA